MGSPILYRPIGPGGPKKALPLHFRALTNALKPDLRKRHCRREEVTKRQQVDNEKQIDEGRIRADKGPKEPKGS